MTVENLIHIGLPCKASDMKILNCWVKTNFTKVNDGGFQESSFFKKRNQSSVFSRGKEKHFSTGQ